MTKSLTPALKRPGRKQRSRKSVSFAPDTDSSGDEPEAQTRAPLTGKKRKRKTPPEQTSPPEASVDESEGLGGSEEKDSRFSAFDIDFGDNVQDSEGPSASEGERGSEEDGSLDRETGVANDDSEDPESEGQQLRKKMKKKKGGEQRTVKPMSQKRLEKLQKRLSQRGVIYLSRIPPFMQPDKLRHIMSQFGEIGRIYLTPEDQAITRRRKKYRGKKGKSSRLISGRRSLRCSAALRE